LDNSRHDLITLTENNGQGVRMYRVTRIVRGDPINDRPYPLYEEIPPGHWVTAGLPVARAAELKSNWENKNVETEKLDNCLGVLVVDSILRQNLYCNVEII
jgi:hypothetical protein